MKSFKQFINEQKLDYYSVKDKYFKNELGIEELIPFINKSNITDLFHAACYYKNKDFIDYLLENYNPLHIFYPNIIRSLLIGKFDIKFIEKIYNKVIKPEVIRLDRDIIEVIISKNRLDVYKLLDIKPIPKHLHWAAFHGSIEFLDYLIKSGIDSNDIEKSSYSDKKYNIIGNALNNNKIDMVKHIIKNNYCEFNSDDDMVKFLGLITDDDIEIVKTIYQNNPNLYNYKQLEKAISNSNEKIATYIVDKFSEKINGLFYYTTIENELTAKLAYRHIKLRNYIDTYIKDDILDKNMDFWMGKVKNDEGLIDYILIYCRESKFIRSLKFQQYLIDKDENYYFKLKDIGVLNNNLKTDLFDMDQIGLL